MHPIHIFPPYFPKIHSDIVFLSMATPMVYGLFHSNLACISATLNSLYHERCHICCEVRLVLL